MTRAGATLPGGGAPALAAWRAFRDGDCREVTGFDSRGGAGVAVRSRTIETAAARMSDSTARNTFDRAAFPPRHAG